MCRNKGSNLTAHETVTRLTCTVWSPLSMVLLHVFYTLMRLFQFKLRTLILKLASIVIDVHVGTSNN